MKLKQFDLITTVDLTAKPILTPPIPIDDKIGVGHFIYASQLYGTFFAIYAVFEGKESDSGNAFQITKVTFKLVNYKGVLNIGFTTNDIDVNDTRQEFTFYIRGGSTVDEKEVVFPNQDADMFLIRKGQRHAILFYRNLYPLPDFQGYVDNRLDNSAGLIKGEPPLTELFDTEFNSRDGLEFHNLELREGMYGYTSPSSLRKEELEVVSYRCILSKVILLYA